MTIKKILKNLKEIKTIKIEGWVVFSRGNEKITFISLNDGSTIENLQVVIKNQVQKNVELKSGDSVRLEGKIILTPSRPQPLEMKCEKVELINKVDFDYPIQNQNINLETLRLIPHLRHKTKIIKSVMLIRSTLAQNIHKFFIKNNFHYLMSPIITSIDGEGAGEMFEIKNNIFSNNANLTVTGQLHAEAFANGFKRVYTFGPTFRAEKSHTTRHASEFWMIEPEIAFYQLKDIIEFSDIFLKDIINETIEIHKEEFSYLDEISGKKLLNKINLFLKNKIKIIKYEDCIEILKKNKVIFENENIEFGLDFSIEHEKFLTNQLGPIAVTNYPKEIKAFYMSQNKDGKTVECFDFLVPGIGELIGGSQRENNYEKLLKRIKEENINEQEMKWYLDLRRFGAPVSSGFGLGFERLLMFLTEVGNIRDVIPFPRTTGIIKM